MDDNGERGTEGRTVSLDDQKALAMAVATANLSTPEKIEAFMAGIRAVDPAVNIRISFTYPRLLSGPRCGRCRERPPCDPKGCDGCTHMPACPGTIAKVVPPTGRRRDGNARRARR